MKEQPSTPSDDAVVALARDYIAMKRTLISGEETLAIAKALVAAVSERGTSSEDAKNAARWNVCLRLRQFPVRLQQQLYKEGGYVAWTINGKYYGLTENECADDAVSGERNST